MQQESCVQENAENVINEWDLNSKNPDLWMLKSQIQI